MIVLVERKSIINISDLAKIIRDVVNLSKKEAKKDIKTEAKKQTL